MRLVSYDAGDGARAGVLEGDLVIDAWAALGEPGRGSLRELVAEARRQRNMVDDHKTDWVVVRNRMTVLETGTARTSCVASRRSPPASTSAWSRGFPSGWFFASSSCAGSPRLTLSTPLPSAARRRFPTLPRGGKLSG